MSDHGVSLVSAVTTESINHDIMTSNDSGYTSLIKNIRYRTVVQA